MARPRRRSKIPIFQAAHGSQADAQIDNSGTIAFHAECQRAGGGAAFADAFIETIQQIATAMGTERFLTLTTGSSHGTFAKTSAAVGPASAEIVNSGMIASKRSLTPKAEATRDLRRILRPGLCALPRVCFSSRSEPTPKSGSTTRASFDISIKASATGEENAVAFALGD